MALVIEMEGGPRERGLAYGETARPLIAEAAERWQQDAGADAAALEHALVQASGFRAAARRWAPALVDEVDAIAAGSGIDGDRIWALNLLDEGWWMRHSNHVSSACSGFAVSPGASGRTLLAQNMDLPTWVDGLLVLLDIRPGGDAMRVLAPAYAGIVATNACNSAGLGVCVNTLGQLPTSLAGLPVAFVIRLLAEQRSVADATLLLQSLPHASGQNYLLGDRSAIVDVECGAGTTTVIEPGEPPDNWIAHTNHPLNLPPPPDDGGVVDGSWQRLQALETRLGRGGVDAADAAALLAAPPLCRHHREHGAFTFYSVVMELSDRSVLHLSDGPPCESNYERFELYDGRG